MESVKEGSVNFFWKYFLDLFISYSKDLNIFSNCIHPLISKEKRQKKKKKKKKRNSDICERKSYKPAFSKYFT